MDKYEYKVRADEIKELIARGEYPQAVDIADTIDWRRVKSVMMLCTISDLYKISRRYEDAKNMLLLAYERRPWGKTICYSLCELCIKTEELSLASNYYKEFVQIAPKDSGRYILQYKLCEAWDVSLEERISVLEELKQKDYREKWAYELAYLYHRVGLATRCVEECDELILWFGEGKYVIKAMELKMLHQPLSASQQEKYDHRFDMVQKAAEKAGANDVAVGAVTAQEKNVQTNLTAAAQDAGMGRRIAQMPAVKENLAAFAEAEVFPKAFEKESADLAVQETAVSSDTRTDWVLSAPRPETVIMPAPQAIPEEIEIQVKTVDVGAYNTINLQAEIAAGLQEVLAEDDSQTDAITRSILAPLLNSDTENLELPGTDEAGESVQEPEKEIMEGSEVFFSETEEMSTVQEELPPTEEDVFKEFMGEEAAPQEAAETQETMETKETAQAQESAETQETGQAQESASEKPVSAETPQTQPHSDETADIVMRQLRMENMLHRIEQALMIQPPKELAGVLSQESDGQISLVVPESEKIEKQITGQMNLEDVLIEWEKLKRENEAKRQEEVRQHVLEQTGSMFAEFEESVKSGLLEQLESEPVEEETEHLSEELAEEAVEPEESEESKGEPKETEELEESAEQGVSEEETAEQEGQEEPAESEEEEEQLAEGSVEESVEEAVESEEPEGAPKESEELGGSVEQGGSEEKTTEQEGQEEPAEPEGTTVRALTREEKELYAPFIQSRSGRERLVKAIDSISMAAYTGNVIITGEKGMDTLSLAKNMVREFQMTDSNFSGKVAKVSGQGLNSKNMAETLGRLESGALIVQEASGMEASTVEALQKALQKENFGIIVFLEDTKKAIEKMMAAYPKLQESFTARMDVDTMSNDSLVAFGRQYAKEMEYSIDDLGILALHTRVEERQSIDHVVTVLEVKDIVDAAIRHANRKTMGHFFDILLAKRYDEEDMIILTEKDFV